MCIKIFPGGMVLHCVAAVAFGDAAQNFKMNGTSCFQKNIICVLNDWN